MPISTFAKMSIRRNIGVFVAVLSILVGGTWAIVKITTDYLLYQNATSAARGWARYLAESVTDLEQIRRTIGALGCLPEESLSVEAREALLAAFRGWSRR